MFAFRQVQVGFLGLLTLILLLATACSNLAPSVLPEPTSTVTEAANPSIPFEITSERRVRFERISLEQGLSKFDLLYVARQPGVYVVWHRGWAEQI
jgi:hypothetical protein